jgi:hypothetical protein
MSAYSLRDNAQLLQYKKSKVAPQRITYDPAHDLDPRRQDAAKVVVPAGQVSLKSTVRFPIGTSDGTTTLITWDAWFGSEFRYEYTGIGNYKTFQFASPAKRIWFEVRTLFIRAEAPGVGLAVRRGGRTIADKAKGGAGEKPTAPPADDTAQKGRARPLTAVKSGGDIGALDVRAYGAPGIALGPNVRDGKPLMPKSGSFTVRAETWTRYWVLIEQRANDWDPVSLWVADENTDPVQIIDRRQLQVSPRAKGGVESFWFEYNSSSAAREGLGERVGYVRNLVMLRNVKDVPGLLQRPVK